MRAIDTSAWIELIRGTAVGAAIKELIPSPEKWVVPTIVQYELAKWLAREIDPSRAIEIIDLTRGFVVVPLSTELALLAAAMAKSHRLATADAIIYVTAISTGADLVTCDEHFEGLPDVTYLAKRKT